MANIKWALDPTHSEVTFKVRHLMISTVTGQFKKFDVIAETETDDFSSVKNIKFTAEIDSISTNEAQRDGHLKSPDFFDAAKYPQLTFVSKNYDANDGEKLNGELTMHGVTKPITLNVEFGGIAQDPYGQTKAGFTVTGKINRKEFDLKWCAVTETGNVVLSDEVKINVEIQLVKQVKELVEEEIANNA